jgi:hypothetical protein
VGDGGVDGDYELMAYQTSSTKGSGYGNTLIDSLIWGCQWTNSPSNAGTFTNSSPVEITYDFASSGYWTLAGKTTYAASWSSEYIGVVEAALSTYENFCNVNFTFSTNNANLKFFQLPSTYWSQAGVLGECDVPDGTYIGMPQNLIMKALVGFITSQVVTVGTRSFMNWVMD